MVSEPSTTAIDISKEDIWADFSIQFGADSSAQIYDADAKFAFVISSGRIDKALLFNCADITAAVGSVAFISVSFVAV